MPRSRRLAERGLAGLAIAATLSVTALPGAQASPAAHCTPAHSAAPAPKSARAKTAADPPGDEGLFEFLGGIGSENARWIDYLSSTDPAKVSPAHPGVPQRSDRSDETAEKQ